MDGGMEVVATAVAPSPSPERFRGSGRDRFRPPPDVGVAERAEFGVVVSDELGSDMPSSDSDRRGGFVSGPSCKTRDVLGRSRTRRDDVILPLGHTHLVSVGVSLARCRPLVGRIGRLALHFPIA